MDLKRDVGGVFGGELAESVCDIAGDDQMALEMGMYGDEMKKAKVRQLRGWK